MKIRLEAIPQGDGSNTYDLVLVQGEQTICLSLYAQTISEAMTYMDDIALWIDDHTMEAVEENTSEGGAA